MSAFLVYKVFFHRKDHKKCEFEVHEVYGVDVLISTGDGKAKEGESRTTVYKRTEQTYALKMKASRGKENILRISSNQIVSSVILLIKKSFLKA